MNLDYNGTVRMFKNNLKYIITFLIIYLCWTIVLPIVFKANINNIENVIQAATGYNVDFINPKLRVGNVFHAKLSADEIDILNKNHTKALAIVKPSINIKTLPLITGKTHIRMFEASSLSANFSLDKKLYLGDYLLKKLEEQPNINLDRVKINKYYVSLYDKKSRIPFKLYGHDLYYKSTRSYVIVRGYNTLLINKSKSKIDFNIDFPRKHNWDKAKLNIYVDDLNVQPLTHLLRACVSPSIKEVRGLINVQSSDDTFNMDVFDGKILMKDSAKSIIFPENFNINTQYKINSHIIDINNFVMKGGKLEAHLNGTIDKFQSPTPDYDLVIDIPKSDTRELALLLPPVVVPQFNVYRLKMYPFYGDIDGRLKIRGVKKF